MSGINDGYGYLPDGNEEDGDVCRVCRVEGDAEDPLIYPCKCSGSVRFVHPMCLKDWLAHSHKRYCEICGHKYTFTKIYTDYIPAKIPKVVFVRQTVLWLYRMACHVHRLFLAILGWLIILPSLNLVTLRTLIWIADTSISYPTGMASPSPLFNTPPNITVVATHDNSTETNGTLPTRESLRVRDMLINPVSTMAKLFVHNWRNMYRLELDSLPGFVFRGQILSVTLAAVLVGLLFFREWMNQQNLADFLPPPQTEDEPINTDEWVIQRGVARRVDEVDQMKETSAAVAALLAKRRPDTYRFARADGMARRANRARREARDIVIAPEVEPRREVDLVDAAPGLPEPTQAAPMDGEISVDDANSSCGSPSISGSSRSSPFHNDSGPSRPNGPAPRHSPIELPEPSPSESLPRPYELGEAGPSVTSVAYTAPEMLKEKGKAADSGEPRLVFVDFGARDKHGKPYFPTKILPEARPAALAMARLNRWPVELKFPGQETEHDDPGPEKIIDVSDSDSRGDYGLETSEEVWHEFMDRAFDQNDEFIRFDGESPADDKSDGYVTVDDEVVDNEERSHGSSEDEPPRLRRPSTPAARAGVLRRGDEPLLELPQEPEEVQPDLAIELPRHQRALDAERMNDIDGLDEDIPWEREDWDGVLEVVGLIGPLTNLFQNIAFAITIMGVALTVLVGFPIVTGKVVLALDIARSAFVICRLLLRGIRVLTDPVLDVVFEITKEVIVLPLWSSFQALERIVATRLNLAYSFAIADYFSRSPTESTSWSSTIALTQSYVATAYRLQRDVSLHLATSQSLSDKIWCMLIGYGTVAVVIALIALAGELNIGRISTTLLDGIRHHALFLKLAIFMGVELIIFPLVIGLVIDLCTIPLYEGATISSGLRHMRHSPFGAIFVSWLIGTMFMFTFASFLAHIRARTRKGALFFIRDPADANFSPVKDILERSTASQFRKLAISAVMYTVVVCVVFGITCWGLRYQTLYPILPLRTKKLPPLSSIPFDLLFLHLAIPPTISYIRPYARFASAWNVYWKFTCHAFCLSSLMHGKQHDAHCQRGGPRHLKWLWPMLDPVFQLLFGSYDSAGTYARVPASDRVALLPPSQRRQGGVFVPLTPEGGAKDDEGKLRLLKQDQRARTMKRDPKDDYTVVFLPPYWRTRIHVFIGAAMAVVALGVVVVGILPIIVGRAVFAMFTTEIVHDGYTYVAGAYLCCAATAVGISVRKTIVRTGVASRLRRSTLSTRFKRVLLPGVVNLYAIFTLYLVIPSLVGISFEFHIGQIWKYGLDTETTPVLHFWDAWAVGSALCSTLVGMRSMMPLAMRRTYFVVLYDLAELLHSPIGRDRHRLNRTIVTATLFLLGHLVVPPLVVVGLTALPSYLVGRLPTALAFRFIYPITTLLSLAYILRGPARDRLRKVRQGIIDAEYEIEERIENYEPKEGGMNGSKEVGIVDIEEGEDDDWEDED